MRSILCLIACLLVAFQSTNALINQSINPSQISRFTNDQSIKSYETSGEIYSAIKLGKMTSQSISQSLILPTLTKSLQSTDVSELHAAIGSLIELKQKVKVPESSINTLKQGLQSKNLLIIYHSASSILSLIDAKVVKASDFNLQTIIQSINQFEELDHTHRVSLKTEDSSPYFTAFTWRLLGKMLTVDASNKQSLEQAKTAINHASEALATIQAKKTGEIDASFGLPAHITQPQAVGEMISALVYLHQSLAGKVSFPLNAGEVDKFAQYLVTNGASSDVEEMEAIFAGLYSITQLTTDLQPTVVKIDQSTNQPRLIVSDVLGKPTSINQLTATLNNKDVTLTKNDKGYVIDAKSLKSVEAGIHSLTFKSGSQSIDVPFRQSTSLKSVSAAVYLSESSKGDDANKESMTHPNVFPVSMKADSSKYLHVRVNIESDVAPENVMVMLRRTTSSVPELSSDDSPSTSFMCRKVENSYVSRINLGSLDVLDALGGGGEFIVHILVSHTLYNPSLDWAVADLALSGAQLHGDATRYGIAQPSIEHTFRTSDNRPAYLLPLVFTIAQCALFGILVIGVLSRTSLSFPTSPVEASSALFFQATLAVIIVGYAIYWLKLNIFQGLIATFVLSLVALLAGNKALTARHIRKANAAKKL